jgi:hypothetical protein
MEHTPMNKRRGLARHYALLVLCWIAAAASAAAGAADMLPLSDAALADVQGRDGLSFAVKLNANVGSATLGVADSAGNPAAMNFNNLAVTGVIAGTVDVMSGTPGSPDFVNWAFPNIGGTNSLQIGYDLVVTANGSSLGTSIMFQNLAFNGSSMQWTTSSANGGATFGLALNMAIDNVWLQPNGRGNSSGQMSVSGIKLGAAGSTGTPWVIADVAAQPGILNAVTDAGGNTNVQLGIGWPTVPGTAPTGSLQIDNMTFSTPGGNVNLGASSIGSMQIQYLNIKFKS